MEIKFAFALNNRAFFEKKHFGDAEKFVIYQFNGKQLLRESDVQNPFKTVSGKTKHGLKKKGKEIIELLRERKVSVIVSCQFGDNIRMVNTYFIPVIISGEEPQQVVDILLKYMHWLQDEFRNQPERYKLFTIKNGILKTTIDQK